MDLVSQVEKLISVSRSDPLRVTSRENSRLEFKESFNWGNRADYARTLAAFSNHAGGFIVFGVKDSPRQILGVNAQRFNMIDPAKVTEYLNSRFAPELPWEAFIVEISGVQLGVISIVPAIRRPVVCTKTESNVLRDGDIYYRYRGRTQRIRYPELQGLLQEGRMQERNKLLDHFSRIARLGPENVGVLDLTNGELSGQSGRLLLNKEALDQVQFIREGHIAQTEGAAIPTLQLVGDVEVVPPSAIRPTRVVSRPLAIGEKELLLGFLRQEERDGSEQYLKQACRENSFYMPIYHYARMAGFGLHELKKFIERERRNSNRLLDRISGQLVAKVGSLDSDTLLATERRDIVMSLRNIDDEDFRNAKHLRLFEAITHCSPSEPPTILLAHLAQIIDDDFDSMTSNERTHCRKAVAHLDEVLNRSFVVDTGVGK